MMYTVLQATTCHCQLIHELAWQVFPYTYKEILSPQQTAYMMEWMYSVESLHRQMTQEGHIYLLGYCGEEVMGYVSVQPQPPEMYEGTLTDTFHLQKLYVLPHFQGRHCGSFLFREAIKYIKRVHPAPCLMELNVNRRNKALHFYENMGMKRLREGDFPIGNGYYMNDYIMGMIL